MNQARQIRAGTCDTKDAHINAEKTKEAWPSSMAVGYALFEYRRKELVFTVQP